MQRLPWLRRISIHAPARGATEEDAYGLIPFIFQSTLPRGERLYRGLGGFTCQKFQSTLPRGERPNFSLILRSSRQFQSTLPRGERRLLQAAKSGVIKFQSTLPRGERLQLRSRVLPDSDFNPRSREGSDRPKHGNVVLWKVFQSTLPRGERPCCRMPSLLSIRISIHAPARGATTGAVPTTTGIEQISIHAPARGATK